MSKVEDNLYVNSRLTEIFLTHSILKDKILKKLNINYPASQYEHEKIDVVDWQEFVEKRTRQISIACCLQSGSPLA
jgi:hypothetical protein